MKLLIKKYYNKLQEWFVLKDELSQLFIVITVSTVIILTSGIFLGSMKDSYLLFLDPTELFSIEHSLYTFLLSFILMISGLIMLGFVISVISSSMENTIRKIRMGKLNYIGSGHTIIINYNSILFDILEELNISYKDIKKKHEIVILTDKNDKVEFILDKLKRKNYQSLKIYVRNGDIHSIQRYKELSILSVKSIIIIGDEDIEDEYLRDNNNLKIVNSLYLNKDFHQEINERREKLIPIKSIVMFSNNSYFKNIITKLTNKNFLAIAPKEVLNSILNISMINANFYNIWSELLSFNGYELYFVDPKSHKLINQSYKNIILRQENGLLIGISRNIKSKYEILLNCFNEIILDSDWLIFIALNENKISFKTDTNIGTDISQHYIIQPKETITKNILILGNKRELQENSFLQKGNACTRVNENSIDLFSEEFYRLALKEYDTIVLNINDEILYRISLFLITNFTQEEMEPFIFLVDNSLIAKHLKNAKIKNTIVSSILFSKYITQVSRQVTLNNVYEMLFAKEKADINIIDISELSDELKNNLDLLKNELINHKITYLGTVTNKDNILFESKTLKNMKHIIVFSEGEF